MSNTNNKLLDNVLTYKNIKNITHIKDKSNNINTNNKKNDNYTGGDALFERTTIRELPETLEAKEEWLRSRYTYTKIGANKLPIPPENMPPYKENIRSVDEKAQILGQQQEDGFIDNIFSSDFFPFLGLSGFGWIFYIIFLIGPIILFFPFVAPIILGLSVFMSRIAIIFGIIYALIWYLITYYTVDVFLSWVTD
tara:strand:+ start:842 stop:1426 length:585 start_codon:yes stop_codon:yes gene_type:complete